MLVQDLINCVASDHNGIHVVHPPQAKHQASICSLYGYTTSKLSRFAASKDGFSYQRLQHRIVLHMISCALKRF
jgi:hypothetical protein